MALIKRQCSAQSGPGWTCSAVQAPSILWSLLSRVTLQCALRWGLWSPPAWHDDTPVPQCISNGCAHLVQEEEADVAAGPLPHPLLPCSATANTPPGKQNLWVWGDLWCRSQCQMVHLSIMCRIYLSHSGKRPRYKGSFVTATKPLSLHRDASAAIPALCICTAQVLYIMPSAVTSEEWTHLSPPLCRSSLWSWTCSLMLTSSKTSWMRASRGKWVSTSFWMRPT